MGKNRLPEFWKSKLSDIDSLRENLKIGEARSLAKTPGGRDLWCFTYGDKETIKSNANYNSACGSGDYSSYVDLDNKKPVFLFIAGIHGQETEGIVALNNLISLLETGYDLGGKANEPLLDSINDARLIIIPCANPDGRSRVLPEAILGLTADELRHWGQGRWKDGSLCSWPDCKKVHPIKDHVEFLGGYFNDDGVNLMHDDFFSPMAKETSAILNLAKDEYVDLALQLHGGSNSVNDLLPTAYATREIYEASLELSIACDEVAQKEGLAFNIREIPNIASGFPPPAFNLTSALHHVGGAMSILFESNQSIIDEPGVHYNHEEVYRSHLILFEQTFNMFSKNIRGFTKEKN